MSNKKASARRAGRNTIAAPVGKEHGRQNLTSPPRTASEPSGLPSNSRMSCSWSFLSVLSVFRRSAQ